MGMGGFFCRSMSLATLIFAVGCASSVIKSSTNEPPKEKELSEIHTDLGTSALMSEDLPRAIENLRIALEYDKNNSVAHNHMGLALLGMGKRDDALKSFKKALDINPKYSDAAVNLGTWYFASGDYTNATKYYQEALNNLEYKRRFLPLTSLGHIELTRGNLDQAKTYLIQATNDNPDYCLARMLLGNIYFRENRLEKAASEYKLSVKGMCVKNVEGQYELGITYFRLKQFDKARQAFNQIIDQFPNSPLAERAGERLREMP